MLEATAAALLRGAPQRAYADALNTSSSMGTGGLALPLFYRVAFGSMEQRRS
jgi:hypothetical protein